MARGRRSRRSRTFLGDLVDADGPLASLPNPSKSTFSRSGMPHFDEISSGPFSSSHRLSRNQQKSLLTLWIHGAFLQYAWVFSNYAMSLIDSTPPIAKDLLQAGSGLWPPRSTTWNPSDDIVVSCTVVRRSVYRYTDLFLCPNFWRLIIKRHPFADWSVLFCVTVSCKLHSPRKTL